MPYIVTNMPNIEHTRSDALTQLLEAMPYIVTNMPNIEHTRSYV